MLPLLVTGGCGFIGSNYIRYLIENEPSLPIVNLDALTYAGNLANLTDLQNNSRYRFVHGDITDKAAVRRAIGDGVCGLVNFAAESHVDRSIIDSGPFIRTNVVGTQVLLDAARDRLPAPAGDGDRRHHEAPGQDLPGTASDPAAGGAEPGADLTGC